MDYKYLLQHIHCSSPTPLPRGTVESKGPRQSFWDGLKQATAGEFPRIITQARQKTSLETEASRTPALMKAVTSRE